MNFKRICLIVLDSVGIGELPDAARFGDVGATRLGILPSVRALSCPTWRSLGWAA